MKYGKMVEEGTKDDDGKLDFTLLTIDLAEQVESVVRVLMHGAKMHGERNWRLPPLDQDRIWNKAIQRHSNSLNKYEMIDDGEGGTGEPHEACMIASLLFRMWHKDKKNG